MQFKQPKNDDKYCWTNHVKDKMVYYGISESLIKRIVRFPKRKEEGVAPRTSAVMQPTSSKKQEVWVMYQPLHQTSTGSEAAGFKGARYGVRASPQPKVRIISAWRYPGVSPVGKKIPIPDEILQELSDLIE